MLQEFIKEARAFYYVRRTKHRRESNQRMLGYNEAYKTARGTWFRLGSGYYGEAWGHTEYSDLVFKLSGPNGWGYDHMGGDEEHRNDVWQAYAQHCMQNPHPHLPRIMHFEQTTGGMAWAVMPKYTEWGESATLGELGTVRKDLYARRTHAAWLLPLIQIADMPYVQIDLHSGNIMRDPETHDFVLLDPFSTTGESWNDYDRGGWTTDTADRTTTSTDDSTEEGVLQC